MPSAATAAQQHFLQFAIQWSSIALLYYDYMLTFPSELKYIWKSGIFKVSSGLYILYRYALLANVLYLLAISNKLGSKDISEAICDAWYKVIGAVSVLGRAAVIFTFLMRTYAIYNKNIIILIGLGAIGLTCVILDCVSWIVDEPASDCEPSSPPENTLLSILVCVFEASATLLTFFRSMQALKFGGGPLALRKHTLDYLIVEQGVLYFGLVSVFTVGATVLNFKASGGFPQRLLNAITLPLSGLLTARFLLRIRAYGNNPNALTVGDATTQELSSFAATSNAGAEPRFRHPGSGLSSLADEFGEDPVAMMSRAVDSAATAHSTASDEGEEESGGRRRKVVAEFLGQMRRGLEREDRSYYEGEDGMTQTRTSVSGFQSEFSEEKKRQTMGTVGTTDDVEAGDHGGHDPGSIGSVEEIVETSGGSEEAVAVVPRGGTST
ncbi:hypothetical protein C8Q74DRAFT_1366994 [Fomes fomentarius]|nr:hypothetical protein C8Q74DRAFT_1366994 [Fomes fomentarius]